MDAINFLKTIYLGDRACKKILVDGWNRRFCMQVNCISRLEKGTDQWNYYNDENIVDGWLVFNELISISITPEGAIPNDLIAEINARKLETGYAFELFVAAGVGGGHITEVVIKLIAAEIAIETNENFLTSLGSN